MNCWQYIYIETLMMLSFFRKNCIIANTNIIKFRNPLNIFIVSLAIDAASVSQWIENSIKILKNFHGNFWGKACLIITNTTAMLPVKFWEMLFRRPRQLLCGPFYKSLVWLMIVALYYRSVYLRSKESIGIIIFLLAGIIPAFNTKASTKHLVFYCTA